MTSSMCDRVASESLTSARMATSSLLGGSRSSSRIRQRVAARTRMPRSWRRWALGPSEPAPSRRKPRISRTASERHPVSPAKSRSSGRSSRSACAGSASPRRRASPHHIAPEPPGDAGLARVEQLAIAKARRPRIDIEHPGLDAFGARSSLMSTPTIEQGLSAHRSAAAARVASSRWPERSGPLEAEAFEGPFREFHDVTAAAYRRRDLRGVDATCRYADSATNASPFQTTLIRRIRARSAASRSGRCRRVAVRRCRRIPLAARRATDNLGAAARRPFEGRHAFSLGPVPGLRDEACPSGLAEEKSDRSRHRQRVDRPFDDHARRRRHTGRP